MTLKANVPAQRLIESVGFMPDYEERMSKAYYFYMLTRSEFNKRLSDIRVH